MNSPFVSLFGDAAEGTFFLPPAASEYANAVDPIFDFINYICIFAFLLCMGIMLRFMIKYKRKSPDQRTSPVSHNFRLEFLWSAIPTILMVVMFAWGFSAYSKLPAQPADAVKVRVIGQKWSWLIQYPDLGRECGPELFERDSGAVESMTTFYLPADIPYSTQMSSADVIHSFWIPAFRTKKDVIPNHYTGYTDTPNVPGLYPVYCAEYCGKDHSVMQAQVEVLDAAQWKQFVNQEGAYEGVCVSDVSGPALFSKFGCGACHTVDKGGARLVGPNLYGKWGTKGATESGEREFDEAYFRESLMDPGAKIVKGFPAGMPTFKGRLSEAELAALMDYIKGLNDAGTGDDAANDK